ncbi:MAG TPA: NYN domain-containing protein, partial [Phototrophicaceae bacterium]|nr:NYN domain-containing protein [Phototrophicaceae bacterium]
MTYLIDGHNLIGKLPDIDLDDPNDEALLVQKLIGFSARTRQRCVVIFDQGLPGGASRMSTTWVKVVFAPHNSNADRVMTTRISGLPNPKEWTVVSSDNDVLAAARRRKMQTLKSAEFAALMQRPDEPDKPGVDEAPDVHLSDSQVDEWMTLFNQNPDK